MKSRRPVNSDVRQLPAMPRSLKPSRLKEILQGPVGVLIFGGGMVLVVFAIAIFAIGVTFRDLGQWSFDEVARAPQPNANVDAVLVETNGGATTSFGYEVFVLPRGQKPERSAHPVVSLYGAIRNDHAYGANLRWTSNDTLVVEYLNAQHSNWLNGSLGVNGRVVNIVLKSGVTDPTAPSGGMLYNLQGRPRGAVEQIVGPEPRAATFASSMFRRSCSVTPWPGQLRRSPFFMMKSIALSLAFVFAAHGVSVGRQKKATDDTWVKVSICEITFLLPPDMRKLDTESIDSCIAAFSNGNMSLVLDFGF